MGLHLPGEIMTWVSSLLLIITEVTARSEVRNFLVDNGHHYADIFYNNSSNDWRQLIAENVYFTGIQIEKTAPKTDNAFGVFFFDPEKDDMETYLNRITQRRIKMSLIVIARPTKNYQLEMLQASLLEMDAASFFYVAILQPIGSEPTSWYQVISLKSGSVVNGLTFADNSSRIIESFDLKGLLIRSASLTWTPYLIIDDCNEFGLECKQNYGYYIDYMDLLAAKFNFTYVSQKNMEDDWGLVPKTGPFSLNGSWGGVLGDVINRKYDLSLSDWFWNNDRNALLQFVPTSPNSVVLVMKPHQSKVDFGLFARAFAGDAWVGIVLTASAAASCIFLSSMSSSGQQSNGPKMVIFISMVFFVLANSFYCGVLTMFFTYPASKLFETERDVMQARVVQDHC